MNAKTLIEILGKLPPDTPVRLLIDTVKDEYSDITLVEACWGIDGVCDVVVLR